MGRGLHSGSPDLRRASNILFESSGFLYRSVSPKEPTEKSGNLWRSSLGRHFGTKIPRILEVVFLVKHFCVDNKISRALLLDSDFDDLL